MESPGITTTEARTPDTFILTRICKLLEMTWFRVSGILGQPKRNRPSPGGMSLKDTGQLKISEAGGIPYQHSPIGKG